MEKKNRNGATGREVYTGQLGLLNHNPEEQTQKPIVEKKQDADFVEPPDLFPKRLCACRSERSLHNQIRLRSQSEAALH